MQDLPELVLLDMMLSGMDGLQVLGKLKENPQTEAIPVILLSGSPKAESAALNLGASNYIIKPFEPSMLAAAVNSAIRDSASAGPRVGGGDNRAVAQEAAPLEPRASPDSVAAGAGSAVIRTGIIPLDQVLAGGIPLSSLALIEGAPSVGKSILCQHLAYGSLQDGHGVAYLTSGDSPEGLVAQMGSMGLDVSRHLQTGRFSIHAMERPAPGQEPGDLLASLAQEIEGLVARRSLTIVDSVGDLAHISEDNAVVRFFSNSEGLCAQKRAIIMVARSYIFSESLLSRLHSLCNSHLSLKEEMMAKKAVKTLEVRKIGGVESRTPKLASFEVVPGMGIRILPGVRVKI